MAQSTSRPPTLGAVARIAGVSISTVSKVLNGRPDVAPDTRVRVAALLGRAGYPIADGQAVRRRETGGLVEVVANRLDGPTTSRLLRAVCLEACARGFGVVVTDVEPDGGPSGRRPPRRWLEAMSARSAGAVISLLLEFSDAQLAYFDAHAIAACAVGAGRPQARECAVLVDERTRGHTAVRHLLDLGHTRIAVVAGPANVPGQQRLVDGCIDALQAAEVRTDDEYVLRIGRTAEDYSRAALGLLSLRTPPTAIAFADHCAALGACAAFASKGLRIPGDISVICCDGLQYERANATDPPLTRLVQPLDEMARAAMDLMSAHRAAAVLDVPARLVVRGSTAAPGRAA
ncbi:LacI family DNA-binding transcriptional regulator [Actinospica sp. MGRD01-02]|uniref:LacI family DNA-binding transcriptional regulator n=1 Tax=Actinospica acidithermotolerans TaxID=2828514 RepID=A0A941ILA7_9ACTN|nr:LacI family DNA-binding transcriptional regulator [Actinospica acidithermotolerans]